MDQVRANPQRSDEELASAPLRTGGEPGGPGPDRLLGEQGSGLRRRQVRHDGRDRARPALMVAALQQLGVSLAEGGTGGQVEVQALAQAAGRVERFTSKSTKPKVRSIFRLVRRPAQAPAR